jgi:hypothetical protein
MNVSALRTRPGFETQGSIVEVPSGLKIRKRIPLNLDVRREEHEGRHIRNEGSVMNMELLRDAISRQSPNLLPLLERLEEGGLSADELNELREAVSDEFLDSGLRPDYEPNERGLQLEDLIDELAPWNHGIP